MGNTTFLSTSENISTGDFTTIYPPRDVMRTAVTPDNPKDPFSYGWTPVKTTDRFFIYMHYAETEMLERNQTREFNIYINGNLSYGPFSPLNHTTVTVYSTEPFSPDPTYTLTLNRTKKSTLPPLINGLELYTLKQLPQLQTNDQDGKCRIYSFKFKRSRFKYNFFLLSISWILAAAMWSIKSTYRLIKNWQGDPCVPREYVWDGIGCSYNATDFPRIVLL